MDFLTDIDAEAREWLRRIGHDEAEVTDSPYLMFLRLMHRTPLAKKRIFRMSLVARRSTGRLSAEEQQGFAALKETVEAGESLYPRLSKQIIHQWDDDMLNDWGIYHFHLGTRMERKGFYNRSSNVAFAMALEDQFLLINFLAHGRGHPEPWAKDGLLSIVRKEWPAVMAKYAIKGVTDVSPALSEEDRLQLRRAGISLMVNVGGQVYAPPGGGVTTDRGSASIMMDRNSHMYELRQLQKAWLLRFPEREAKLRLLPRSKVLIETAEGELWLPANRGQEIERVPVHREEVFRYLLSRPSPF